MNLRRWLAITLLGPRNYDYSIHDDIPEDWHKVAMILMWQLKEYDGPDLGGLNGLSASQTVSLMVRHLIVLLEQQEVADTDTGKDLVLVADEENVLPAAGDSKGLVE